jgi:hypothetical protein
MNSLFDQFINLNLLKDVLIPMFIVWAGIFLAIRKFKTERLWQDKYSVYQELLNSIEAMRFWAEQAAAILMRHIQKLSV